jgi:hypothetical protein
VTEEVHVVDVMSGWDLPIWQVNLSNGKAMHVFKSKCPDELSAYAYITNKLKEQANGTNART